MTAARERVLSRLIIDPAGCLLWTGALSGVGGYGQFSVDRRQRLVHRLMYEWFAGPIPAGMQIDHLCRVRRCANVAHLEVVTPRENTRRGMGTSGVNARKTHCGHGHAFDEQNTGILPGGQRQCRACNAEQNRRYRARQRAV